MCAKYDGMCDGKVSLKTDDRYYRWPRKKLEGVSHPKCIKKMQIKYI